jgi:hypothetical protein
MLSNVKITNQPTDKISVQATKASEQNGQLG